MNSKVIDHLQRATDLLKFGGSDLYTKNAQQALGFGSNRVQFLDDGRYTELSMQQFHDMLRSARGSTEHPGHAPAFVRMCLQYFHEASIILARSDSLHSEMNVIRAFKAAMMISGMADECLDLQMNDLTNTTGASANTFQYNSITYEYSILRTNLLNFKNYNKHDRGQRYDKNTIKEMILEMEEELIKLLQTITPEELRQITIEELGHLKTNSEMIFRNLRNCSKAYWKATVARQSERGSVRQVNQQITANKRQRGGN